MSHYHGTFTLLFADGRLKIDCVTPVTKQLSIYDTNQRDVTSEVMCIANVPSIANCDFVKKELSADYVSVRNDFLYELKCRQDPINVNQVLVNATMNFPIFDRNFTGEYALRLCNSDNPHVCQISVPFLIIGKFISQ